MFSSSCRELARVEDGKGEIEGRRIGAEVAFAILRSRGAEFLQSDKYTQAYNEALALGGDGVTTPTARTEEQPQIELEDVIERNIGITSLRENIFFFSASSTGTVYNDQNANGSQDRREQAMPQVPVELLNDVGELIETTRTDRSGHYRLTEVPETGDFQVRIVLSWQSTIRLSQRLSVR